VTILSLSASSIIVCLILVRVFDFFEQVQPLCDAEDDSRMDRLSWQTSTTI